MSYRSGNDQPDRGMGATKGFVRSEVRSELGATEYSVWDPHRKAYDYYHSLGRPPSGPPEPGHLSKRAIGIAPQRAAWPLPMGAKWVGRGQHARGFVAETAAGRAMGDFSSSTLMFAAAGAVVVWLLWRS